MRIDLYELADRLNISYEYLNYYLKHNKKLSEFIEHTDVIKKIKTKDGRIFKRTYLTRVLDTIHLEEFKTVLSQIKNEGKRPRYAGRELLCWTDTALICYKNKFKCEKCEQKEYCETAIKSNIAFQIDRISIPPLKKLTLEILAKLGEPPKHLLDEV